MICGACQQVEVSVGAVCPRCGIVAVAPELLDSVLSLPPEPVPELPDDEPESFRPLAVEPDAWAAAPEPPTPGAWDQPTEASPEPSAPPAPPSVPSPTGPPLPRRTPLDETAPQWGPREHPPAVLAPPAPLPLDAPPPRVKRPQGTGLPSGIAGAASATPPPAEHPVPPAAPLSVPQRPTHPRVRRWFGRGSEEASTPPPAAGPEAVPVEVAPDGPFPGAPAGLLDGVDPEPDLGPGVIDPGGLEAAMGRMSTGARRAALAPLATVAALLEPGERAEAVVQGEYQHRPAVVVLTDRRVLIANDRRWAPDVRSLVFEARLKVHGWQDERRATLVFELDGVGVAVRAISDRPLAVDLAQRVRSRCAGEGPGARS